MTIFILSNVAEYGVGKTFDKDVACLKSGLLLTIYEQRLQEALTANLFNYYFIGMIHITYSFGVVNCTDNMSDSLLFFFYR